MDSYGVYEEGNTLHSQKMEFYELLDSMQDNYAHKRRLIAKLGFI